MLTLLILLTFVDFVDSVDFVDFVDSVDYRCVPKIDPTPFFQKISLCSYYRVRRAQPIAKTKGNNMGNNGRPPDLDSAGYKYLALNYENP